MNRLLLFLLVFLLASPSFAADVWTTYTDTSDIRDIAAYGDYIWCATTGGAVRLNRTTGAFAVFYRSDGLADNVVNAVTVDSTGAVWFGTKMGLSRYDGSKWTTWTTADGLANNVVSGVAFDASGAAWITMNGGGIEDKESFNWSILQSFDGKSFVTRSSGKTVMGSGFSSLTLDPVHQWIWTCAWYGAFRFDSVTLQNEWYYTMQGYPGTIPSAFDSTGTAWFVWKGQYITFDGSTWSAPAPADTSSTGALLSMVMDRSGVKWFASEKGLARFNGVSWTLFTPARFPDENPTRLFAVDDDGCIWGVSPAGITRFDGEHFTVYTTPVTRPGNRLRTVAVDRENVKWFCLEGQGAASFDGLAWRIYTAADGLALEPVGDRVFAITVDHNNVKWFGTWAGVSRFDGKTWTTFTKEVSQVWALAVDSKNVLWIGMYGGGVMTFDGATWSNRTPPGINSLNSIMVGPDDRVWVGTNDYLFVYDGSWSHITTGPPTYCGALLVDRANTLWAASGSGSPTGTTRFRNGVWEARVPLPLPIDAPVYALAEDANGVIWAAAAGNGNFDKHGQGVASFDGKTWTAYTTQTSGLVDNGVWGVAVDRDNVKWFATEGGVSALRDSITTPTMVSEYTAPRPLPLLSNHPNPFNPSTTITFTLPSSGRATLTVYSLTGQKVRGLLSENLGASAHSVVWDGRDDGGRTLSSGVYIVLLRMGSTAAAIKMTLEK